MENGNSLKWKYWLYKVMRLSRKKIMTSAILLGHRLSQVEQTNYKISISANTYLFVKAL